MFRRAAAKFKESNHNLLSFLMAAIVCVVILHIFWQLLVGPYPPPNTVLTDLSLRFGLDSELSVPTWLSAVLSLFVALSSYLVARAQHEQARKVVWYLVVLLGIFISLDEVSALHELLLQGLHILANFGEGQSFSNNAWLLVLPFIVGGFGWLMWFFRRLLPSDTFWHVFTALGVYLGGALVVEFLSIPVDKASLEYRIGLVVVEESLEMIGQWLLLRAILEHISRHERDLRDRLVKVFNA